MRISYIAKKSVFEVNYCSRDTQKKGSKMQKNEQSSEINTQFRCVGWKRTFFTRRDIFCRQRKHSETKTISCVIFCGQGTTQKNIY